MSDDGTTEVDGHEQTTGTSSEPEVPEPSHSESTTPKSRPETSSQPSPSETAAASETVSEESVSKFQASIRSLSSIITSIPASLSTISTSTNSSDHPAIPLLHDPDVSSQISALLRQTNSGSGDNNLCRWLYDTFQSNDPCLQLLVLRFVPTVAGLYLSRIPIRKPLAGFEAVLLALYANETAARAGQPVTVNVPDLSHPSLYHESPVPCKNNATALNLAVISPSLEPHGTVRSTRRARIVGVALELYYSKIHRMPVASKIEFCEFCKIWAGKDTDTDTDTDGDGEEEEEEENMVSIEVDGRGDSKKEKMKKKKKKKEVGRIPFQWELLRPVLRILGHCLLGGGDEKEKKRKELREAAMGACKSLYGRSMHDIDAKAILATDSLLRLGKTTLDPNKDVVDHTEISISNVISI